jgi:hypothetical protein
MRAEGTKSLFANQHFYQVNRSMLYTDVVYGNEMGWPRKIRHPQMVSSGTNFVHHFMSCITVELMSCHAHLAGILW